MTIPNVAMNEGDLLEAMSDWWLDSRGMRLRAVRLLVRDGRPAVEVDVEPVEQTKEER